MQIKPVTLLDLNKQIKSLVKESGLTCWITAEISEIKENYSGHCYLELIQKNTDDDQIIARSRATIWATSYRMIKPYFETTTGQKIIRGINIMVKATAEFHEVYGLSLNITDIEPTYTIGELALRRQKVIEKLQSEGVFEMNKELKIPVPCRKIAIISSATAAGYEDFVHQLTSNPFRYKYYVKLFPAIMQGDEAERSIIDAFEKIYTYENFFDVVVIIRGGGSQADLSCFNNYWLAYHITQFPMPIITGIGHEQDDSVADLVAHTRLKTPTAVADFLIENTTEVFTVLRDIQEEIIHAAEISVEEKRQSLTDGVYRMQKQVHKITQSHLFKTKEMGLKINSAARQYIFLQYLKINQTQSDIIQDTQMYIIRCSEEIQSVFKKIPQTQKHIMHDHKQNLRSLEERARYLDPSEILKRGYSITLFNSQIVKNTDQVNSGDLIETIIHDGKLKSIIQK